MLVLDTSKIPPEGLDLREELTPEALHFAEGEEFGLAQGGSFRAHVELGDDESVHVRGHLAVGLVLTCGRCLAAFPLPVDQDVDLFCLPHRAEQEQEDEVELTERDMVVTYYREHRIDLGELVREQLVLTVPMRRLCREDCRGLCRRCGEDRNRKSCDCPAEEPDRPLASLGRLLGR